MAIQIRCAWCGANMGSKESDMPGALDVTHTICPACLAGIDLRPASPLIGWDGIERRTSAERRIRERRSSMRYVAGTLIVIDGMSWIDNEGTDRRNRIRRSNDREHLGKRILEGKV